MADWVFDELIELEEEPPLDPRIECSKISLWCGREHQTVIHSDRSFLTASNSTHSRRSEVIQEIRGQLLGDLRNPIQ